MAIIWKIICAVAIVLTIYFALSVKHRNADLEFMLEGVFKGNSLTLNNSTLSILGVGNNHASKSTILAGNITNIKTGIYKKGNDVDKDTVTKVNNTNVKPGLASKNIDSIRRLGNISNAKDALLEDSKTLKATNTKANWNSRLRENNAGTAASLQHKAPDYTGADDASWLYHIDIEGIKNRSVNGTLMKYLPGYKNPCWKERDPSSPNREQLVCVPYVYVVGMAKCGTSGFYSHLTLLPDIAAPVQKEPYFWNRNRFHRDWKVKWDKYIKEFKNASLDIQQIVDVSQDRPYHPKITVDSSPEYIQELFDWKDIPGNKGLTEPKYVLAHTLKRIYPEAKIIMLLRNPIDRTFSHYHHFSRRSFNINSFAKAVPKELALFKACLKSKPLRTCAYDTQLYRTMDRQTSGNMGIIGSIYVPFVKDWLSVFPRHQVLILRSEDYYRNTTRTMESVAKFLDIRSLDKSLRHKFKYRIPSDDYPAMPSVTRNILDKFFQPYNKLLADLLDDDRFLWIDDADR